MSGEIFQPMECFEDLDLTKRNPLLCYLCNEQYDDPCILGCFHSYCARCLRGRASDGKMACPLCSSMTVLKEGISLPPSDRLLKFMVESSLDEKAQCANCDTDCGHMFFCNTCSQPLCLTCRDETHSAKMFAAHDVVLLSKRTKDIHKQCSLHGEPYIMFSAEKKIMLCINCFRDMRIESRAHCVDLETAYNQSCRKLEQSVQTIRDLQNSTREGILLLKALLDEIHLNSEKEREAILLLFDSMQEKITQCKQSLLEEVDNQYKDKETLFKAQLTDLTSLLPTIHVHLVTAAAFSSSANKFEFLDMSYAMMERLKSIVHRQHPLHPCHSSQINTDFKGQFAKSLEHLLFHGRLSASMTTNSSLQRNGNGVTPPPSISRLDLTKSGNLGSKMSPTSTRRASGNVAKIKFIDAKGVFAEHCVEFETSHRDMLQKLEKLKSEVQELQRDLTLRRCLTRKTAIPDLKDCISSIEQQLEIHQDTIQQKQPILEKHWEESVQRMGNEQELYEAQVRDVHRLQQETQHLKLIASQLTSFVSTIASVTERLAPKVGQRLSDGEHDNQMQSLMEEINAVQPDSQQRVDAIQTCEEVREGKSANRKNPLDEELIKTKGMLKATPVNKVLKVSTSESPVTDSNASSKKDNPCSSSVDDSSVLSKKDNSSGSSIGDSSVLSKKDNPCLLPVADCVLSKKDNSSGSSIGDSSVLSKKDDPCLLPVADCVLSKKDNSSASSLGDSSMLSKKDNPSLLPVADYVLSKKDNSSGSSVGDSSMLSKKDNPSLLPVADCVLSKKDNSSGSSVGDSSMLSKKDNSFGSPVGNGSVLSKKDNSSGSPVGNGSVLSKKDNSFGSPVGNDNLCLLPVADCVLSKKDNSSGSSVGDSSMLSKKDNLCLLPVADCVLSKKDNSFGSPVGDCSVSSKKDNSSGSPVGDSCGSSKKDNLCTSPVTDSSVSSKKDNFECSPGSESSACSKKGNLSELPVGDDNESFKKDNSCRSLVAESSISSKKDNSCGSPVASATSKKDNSSQLPVNKTSRSSKKDNSRRQRINERMLSKKDNSSDSSVKENSEFSIKTDSTNYLLKNYTTEISKKDNSVLVKKRDSSAKKDSFQSTPKLDTQRSTQKITALDADNTASLNNFSSPLHSSLLSSHTECGDVKKNNSLSEEEDHFMHAQQSSSKPHCDRAQINKKDKRLFSSKECSRHPDKDGFELINGAGGDANTDNLSLVTKTRSGFSEKDNSVVKKGDCGDEPECSVEATVILNIES